MAAKTEPTLTFSEVAEWDAWLAKHHARSAEVPPDLTAALARKPRARAFFEVLDQEPCPKK